MREAHSIGEDCSVLLNFDKCDVVINPGILQNNYVMVNILFGLLHAVFCPRTSRQSNVLTAWTEQVFAP